MLTRQGDSLTVLKPTHYDTSQYRLPKGTRSFMIGGDLLEQETSIMLPLLLEMTDLLPMRSC